MYSIKFSVFVTRSVILIATIKSSKYENLFLINDFHCVFIIEKN